MNYEFVVNNFQAEIYQKKNETKNEIRQEKRHKKIYYTETSDRIFSVFRFRNFYLEEILIWYTVYFRKCHLFVYYNVEV